MDLEGFYSLGGLVASYFDVKNPWVSLKKNPLAPSCRTISRGGLNRHVHLPGFIRLLVPWKSQKSSALIVVRLGSCMKLGIYHSFFLENFKTGSCPSYFLEVSIHFLCISSFEFHQTITPSSFHQATITASHFADREITVQCWDLEPNRCGSHPVSWKMEQEGTRKKQELYIWGYGRLIKVRWV